MSDMKLANRPKKLFCLNFIVIRN